MPKKESICDRLRKLDFKKGQVVGLVELLGEKVHVSRDEALMLFGCHEVSTKGKPVYLTVYGKEAKEICQALGLKGMEGDNVDIKMKVHFEVRPAAGRWKMAISFEIPDIGYGAFK